MIAIWAHLIIHYTEKIVHFDNYQGMVSSAIFSVQQFGAQQCVENY